MGSVNKVILIGRLGKDPEIRSMQNGGRVAGLSVATSETWKDKSTGERKEKTEWHRVSVFNDGLVGVIEKHVHKGDQIYIEGSLETRKWTDKNGAEKYSTEVVIKAFNGSITLIGNNGGGGNSDIAPRPMGDPNEPLDSQKKGAQVFDDEVPF